jgi:hypothetical protein
VGWIAVGSAASDSADARDALKAHLRERVGHFTPHLAAVHGGAADKAHADLAGTVAALIDLFPPADGLTLHVHTSGHVTPAGYGHIAVQVITIPDWAWEQRPRGKPGAGRWDVLRAQMESAEVDPTVHPAIAAAVDALVGLLPKAAGFLPHVSLRGQMLEDGCGSLRIEVTALPVAGGVPASLPQGSQP